MTKRKPRPAWKVADEKFSLVIRRRDGACRECGSQRNLQCAHGFTRGYRQIRWDERNAFALCAGCHKFFTHRPIAWDRWMDTKMGTRAYNRLRRDAEDATVKIDVQAVIERLKARLLAMDV